MGRIWKIFALLFLCFPIAGCGANPNRAPRLVTRIQISGVHEDAPVEVVYTQPQKMETILYYLRSLKSLGRARTDPERIMGDHFKITVTRSDGTSGVYFQQANRFLSRNYLPWQSVDPQRAALLYPLLMSMPPDQSSSDAAV